MPVAYDNSTTASASSLNNKLTFNHTTSGNDRYLIVAVGIDEDTGAALVSSVTYNGVSLTREHRAATTFDELQVWRLKNPASGTNEVDITFNDTGYDRAAIAMSYTGVDQTTPIDVSNINTGSSGTTASVSVTTTVADCMLVQFAIDDASSSGISPNSGQTERQDFHPHSFLNFAGADRLVTTAQAYTEQYTMDNTDWAMSCIALAPVSVITPSVQSATFSVQSVTVEAFPVVTYENKASLPTDDTDLATGLSALSTIATDDGSRVALGAGASGFNIIMVRQQNANNTDRIKCDWNGQSTLAPSASIVRLQIYNRNTPGWENVDSDNTTAADTDFDLTGNISTNLSNYYDGNNEVAWRVYQEIV